LIGKGEAAAMREREEGDVRLKDEPDGIRVSIVFTKYKNLDDVPSPFVGKLTFCHHFEW
jgi:hypothetical protein